MSKESLIPTYVPSLISLLANAERDKGSSLTRDEVERIRDHGVCIMLPESMVAELSEASGSDIDPEHVWEQWQAVRTQLANESPPAKPKRGRFRRLNADTELSSLPDDEKERHEAFIEIFGRQLFSIRNEILDQTRDLIEAPQSVRDEMGTIYSKEYTAASQLEGAAQESALNLSRKAVDAFLRELLVLLTHNGLSIDLVLGTQHALAYKLVLQVIQADDLAVTEEHVVNDGGQKVFYEYYGRWLNRHKDA